MGDVNHVKEAPRQTKQYSLILWGKEKHSFKYFLCPPFNSSSHLDFLLYESKAPVATNPVCCHYWLPSSVLEERHYQNKSSGFGRDRIVCLNIFFLGGDKREQQVQLFGECWSPVSLHSLFGL